MTNSEAIEIVWDFQKTYLAPSLLPGDYYDNLREALTTLQDTAKLYDADQWQETERD